MQKSPQGSGGERSSLPSYPVECLSLGKSCSVLAVAFAKGLVFSLNSFLRTSLLEIGHILMGALLPDPVCVYWEASPTDFCRTYSTVIPELHPFKPH